MRILNLGSINCDHVYEVDHFVRPGETLTGVSYRRYAGGKGFNQSVALSRAGARVLHAGRVGRDGQWLVQRLREEGVDTAHIRIGEAPTGHAVIQVVPSGDNAIVLYPGANREIGMEDVVRAVASMPEGGWFLTQNETSCVLPGIEEAKKKGLRVAWNPAPMTADAKDAPLARVDILILNEIEAQDLCGQSDPRRACAELVRRHPGLAVVVTAGEHGAAYGDRERFIEQPAEKVSAVDTTAAGDTFVGFFLAEVMRSGDPGRALLCGCRAAAVCVTRRGASDSIPTREEVERGEGMFPEGGRDGHA